MAIDLDELLRARFEDLVDESRVPLEDLQQDVQRRMGRRRRWRRAGTGGGVLAVVALVLVLAAVLLDGTRPDVRTNADGPPLAPAERVGVERIDAYGGPTGTVRVVVRFDGPVPTDAPRYVDDIEHPDLPGILYTTQRPDRVMVCQNRHSFPGEKGTVDVLIPTEWLTPGIRGSEIPLKAHDNPAKVPVCGGPDDVWPLDRYVQIAIWGPESDDPDDVAATVSPDGTELVVEVQPEEQPYGPATVTRRGGRRGSRGGRWGRSRWGRRA
jgi:hypothetical protein